MSETQCQKTLTFCAGALLLQDVIVLADTSTVLKVLRLKETSETMLETYFFLFSVLVVPVTVSGSHLN
jgi:hypothetical protein